MQKSCVRGSSAHAKKKASASSIEERLKVAVQRNFQFLNELTSFSLLCLQVQQEGRFEELDAQHSTKMALCWREEEEGIGPSAREGSTDSRRCEIVIKFRQDLCPRANEHRYI